MECAETFLSTGAPLGPTTQTAELAFGGGGVGSSPIACITANGVLTLGPNTDDVIGTAIGTDEEGIADDEDEAELARIPFFLDSGTTVNHCNVMASSGDSPSGCMNPHHQPDYMREYCTLFETTREVNQRSSE